MAAKAAADSANGAEDPLVPKGSIAIIGPGRLGCSFGAALASSDQFVITTVLHRDSTTKDALNRARPWFPAAKLLSLDRADLAACLGSADLVLLTVSDGAIVPMAKRIGPALTSSQVLAHCSGMLSSNALQLREVTAGVGSIHPLQSFADPADAELRFRGAYLVCEGAPAAVELGRCLAATLGANFAEIAPEGKVAYHAAAVMASNFLVALTAQAVALAESAGLSQMQALDMLLPLQTGVLENIERVGPIAALTGPIARGDAATVSAHLDEIQTRNPERAALYRSLGRATLELAAQGGLAQTSAAILAKLLAPTD